MGIEYTHYFTVEDDGWLPTKAHAEALHRLLVRWKLARGKPALSTLAGGKKRVVKGRTIETSGDIPPELLLDYGHVQDEGTCGAILGAGAMYFDVQVLLGRELKMPLDAFDTLNTVVDEPPQDRRGREIEELMYPDPVGATSFALEPGDRLPVVTIACKNPADGGARTPPKGYRGWFRSALILDCGKAGPEFAMQGQWNAPNRDFVGELAAAFSAPVVELGVFD